MYIIYTYIYIRLDNTSRLVVRATCIIYSWLRKMSNATLQSDAKKFISRFLQTA